MIKSYMTQLQHVFHIIGKQEENISDGARLLAQALVGEGTIYLYANQRFSSLADTLVQNQDTPERVGRITWNHKDKATAADRLLILSDGSESEEDVKELQRLVLAHIPLVFLGPDYPHLTFVEGMEEPIAITIPASPLVPAFDGTRHGHPTEIAMIYAYQAIMFELLEMIDN